jgi:phosphate transport system permease protein
LALFFVARIIGGRGPGVLTDRQRRAAAAASVRDTQRMAHQMADREIEQRASSPVYTFVPELVDEQAPRAHAPRTFVNPNFPAATPAAAPQSPEQKESSL